MSELSHLLPAGVKSLLENYPSCALWIKARLMAMSDAAKPGSLLNDPQPEPWAMPSTPPMVAAELSPAPDNPIYEDYWYALPGASDYIRKLDAPRIPWVRRELESGLRAGHPVQDLLASLPDDKPAHDWAKDTDHKRVVDVIDSITGGKISKPARDALRGVLDKADAPLKGRAKSDAGLGRAIRYAD